LAVRLEPGLLKLAGVVALSWSWTAAATPTSTAAASIWWPASRSPPGSYGTGHRRGHVLLPGRGFQPPL